jgi:hypothetical protein
VPVRDREELVRPADQRRGEFRLHVKNIGTISCGTQIMLREFTAVNGLWVLPALAPGATTEHWWNNAPNNVAYVPGLVPMSGTPGVQGTCALEVTRRWDLTQASASGGIEREFPFVVKNVGSTRCGGAIILGAAPVAYSFSGGVQAVGTTGTYYVNKANPIDKAFVVGVNPSFPSLYSTCGYEITRGGFTNLLA